MRATWAAIIGLAAAVSCSTALADTPAAELEKGVFEQETAGNLDAAEKIYWQIVETANANRRIAAEAQYRLGLCYQKQGKLAEAQQAFLEVLSSFSGEAEFVGKAQKELDDMERARAPRIVETSPVAYANDVPASLDKITVKFDRKMLEGCWSWTQEDEETFPKRTAEKISYDAAVTTCTMPFQLEPGKVYWVGINGGEFRQFCSAAGAPAPSYVILFATQSADGKPTPIPAAMLDHAKAINAQALALPPVPPESIPAESGTAVPPGATRLSYVKDNSADKWSINGSGHAVLFEKPAQAGTLIAVQIFASRYGMPTPPAEDFHLYLLDEKRNFIGDFHFPYGMIQRSGEMRWYNLPIHPPTAVPQKFYVALSFNPNQTKGIYLGLDKSASVSHSFVGLPTTDFEAATGKFAGDWMVRAVLTGGKSKDAAK